MLLKVVLGLAGWHYQSANPLIPLTFSDSHRVEYFPI